MLYVISMIDEALASGAERLNDRPEKIKFLFQMHDFHRWNSGVVWENVPLTTEHRSDIEKIAMVGETSWE